MADRFYYLAPWVWDESDPSMPHWRAPTHTRGLVDLRPLAPVDTYGFFATDTELVGSDYERFGQAGERIGDATLSQSDRQRWADILGLDSRPAGLTLLDVLWQTLTQYGDPDGGVLCPPLTATHKGVMELHLGGHSLIRSQRFQGVSDPAWPRVQALMQRNYRRIREQAIRATRGEPTLHRKWLEVQRRKYRVDPRLLVPGDLPFESPMRPTTTITDDFNRANQSGLGSSSEGWSWDVLENSGFSISGNRAEHFGGSASLARAQADLSSDDHYAQVVYDEVLGSNTLWIVTARQGQSPADYYGCRLQSTTHRSEKRVSGSSTVLDSSSVSVSHPHTIKIECDGSTIRRYFDGVEQGTAQTDTSITGIVRTGMRSFNSSAADDFEAADLVAGADHELTANGLDSASTVGSPSITQVHDLTADGLASALTVGSPTLSTSSHSLSADGLVSASSVGSPAVEQVHSLTADNLVVAMTVGSPAVSQVHGLQADGLLTATVVGAPNFTENYALVANGLLVDSTVGSPALTETPSTHDELEADGLVSVTTVGSPGLTQVHAFTANGLLVETVVGSPTLQGWQVIQRDGEANWQKLSRASSSWSIVDPGTATNWEKT